MKPANSSPRGNRKRPRHNSYSYKAPQEALSGFVAHDALTTALPQYGVSDLKARCLEIISNVAERGQSCIITKHGEPVARIVPYESSFKSLKGSMRDDLKIVGDIIYCDFSDDWELAK